MSNNAQRQTLPIGTRIDSFRVDEVLGIGGFGITYAAFDERLERKVALKEYFPADLARRDADGCQLVAKEDEYRDDLSYGLRRFLDEARVLARFDHPNIVRVQSFLEAFGTAYLVMDHLEGQTLSRSLKQNVTMDETTIRRLLLPVMLGLRSVHKQDYLHRDIKPSNILIRRDHSPVLIDFGAARLALGQKAEQLTAIATPGYAPIEQHGSNERQGPWTDIYAIGATCFHCAVGKPPIAAPDRLMARYENQSDPLKEYWSVMLAEDYSERFVRSLRWMMALVPGKRPRSIDELLKHFAPQPKRASPAAKPAPVIKPRPSELEEADSQLTDEMVDTLEAEVAARIGPLARPLVRKAAGQAKTLTELRTMLDDYLPLDVPTSPPSTSATSAIPASATVAPVFAEREVDSASSLNSVKLKDDTSQTIERLLSDYIGPIARILIKQAAAQASDTNQLTEILAKELPDPEQRQAFLIKVRESLQ